MLFSAFSSACKRPERPGSKGRGHKRPGSERPGSGLHIERPERPGSGLHIEHFAVAALNRQIGLHASDGFCQNWNVLPDFEGTYAGTRNLRPSAVPILLLGIRHSKPPDYLTFSTSRPLMYLCKMLEMKVWYGRPSCMAVFCK